MSRNEIWTGRLTLVLIVGLITTSGARSAPAQEDPKNIVAAQVRAQGYTCDSPKSARRDKDGSRPDEAAWILECENTTYHVRLVPHRAAIIEVESPF